MDPPARSSRPSIGLLSHAQCAQDSSGRPTPTSSVTLAPSAMSNTKPIDYEAAPHQDVANPHAVVGQISATQTMVVTTTTTTTTSFPPLLLNPPKHLDDMDPKQYPLAASSTPTSIKKLCFDVEGRTTTFEEARDTRHTLGNVSSSEAYSFPSGGSRLMTFVTSLHTSHNSFRSRERR